MGRIEMEKVNCVAIRESDRTTGVKNFLDLLISQKCVDALMVLLERDKKGNFSYALVEDTSALNNCRPLAPVMPRNAAQIISEMTKLSPSKQKIGAVLRPCELRALVELAKFKQANLDNIILIGMDCPGTCTLTDYKKHMNQGGDLPIRKACRVCENSSPIFADLVIGLTGKDNNDILLEAGTAAGEEILKKLKLPSAGEDDIAKRKTFLEKLTAERKTACDSMFQDLNNNMTGLEKLLDTLAPCVNCHNCRVMCPICYCQECFFDSKTFDWESEKYLGWAKQKGALRLPADTLLFHLTRINHMATSCIACGMCSQACPNDVPVFEIFKLAGTSVQKEMEYVPGRSIDDEPPVASFKEDELSQIGK
jgi:formate dehydrogenase (coenzyme F420) beta subunit